MTLLLCFCRQLNVILRVIPDAEQTNSTATSSGRGLVHVTTPTSLHWRDVIKVPRTLRYVVAVRYEVSAYTEQCFLVSCFNFSFSFSLVGKNTDTES